MAEIIDGKKIAREIRDEIKAEIAAGGYTPALAVIMAGTDAASQVYVNNKKKACAEVGIMSLSYALPAETSEAELLALIGTLNNRADVHGILVQLPLPAHIDAQKALQAISARKDVDGFHAVNAGRLLLSLQGGIKPCTPAGIVELLKRGGVTMSGRHCAVIGRSNIVGKPAALLMLAEDATVTVCHSKTENLADVCRQADILIAAVGRARFVTPEMVKPGAVIVDVGIHRQDNGKLCGDVDEACADKAAFITPVPGGVGPMTIAMLMRNCLAAFNPSAG